MIVHVKFLKVQIYENAFNLFLQASLYNNIIDEVKTNERMSHNMLILVDPYSH